MEDRLIDRLLVPLLPFRCCRSAAAVAVARIIVIVGLPLLLPLQSASIADAD